MHNGQVTIFCAAGMDEMWLLKEVPLTSEQLTSMAEAQHMWFSCSLKLTEPPIL